MKVDILSLFPEYFRGPFSVSILKKAQEKGLLEIQLIDIRRFAKGKHAKVDDRPYGGGPGMVLMAEPVCEAIRSVKREGSYVMYLSPQGEKLSSKKCQELAKVDHLILLCGHYEGVDERILQTGLVDAELSIGDYVLTNGGLAAIVVVDATARFIPGVLGHEESAWQESFQGETFDAPHYTRPKVFEGLEVPEVLQTGDHAKIAEWRKAEGQKKFKESRI